MDYTLTDEQRMFLDVIQDFVTKDVAPCAEAVDREEKPPLETFRKAAELDLLGIPFPEDCGGVNAGLLTYCLLVENLAKACLSTAMMVSAHVASAAMAIHLGGTEDQKRHYLVPLARGQRIGAYALSEPDAGSDISAIATRAERDANGWRISGRKHLVVNGDIADIFVVFAKAPELTAFVVERETPGLTIGWREKQMGLRGASASTLFFDQVHVPASNLLGGGPGGGAELASQVWDYSRLSVSYAALGAAEGALTASLSFARDRQQFGGPIALKQAIQGMIGDMVTEVESLRQLLYYTTWLVETGRPHRREVAMAKYWAGKISFSVVNRAVQIHGGMGYVKRFPIERMYRDVRALSIHEGTNEVQKLQVAQDVLATLGVVTTL